MSAVATLDQTYLFRGQAVRYSVTGRGPPLLFVHGTPFSSHVWHRIAPHFSSSHTVYRFDLLGYGQSEMKAGQDVSLGVQNQLLSELITHWRLEHPDVVAHDFGGATALRTHLLNGHDYRSLTLIDPVALSPWGSPFVQHVRRNERAFVDVPGYIHEAIVAAYLRGAAHRELGQAALAAYSAPWLGTPGQAAFYRQITQMDEKYTQEVQPRYGMIRCPTQILWGQQDRWIPPLKGRELQRLIPGAALHPIADAGHLVQEDAPEAVVASLCNFLIRT
ncbi:MAG: alpha/beta hydrolase [Proteobacteria bacterium]|nr:alpha/beta hydrolase [Pseudomonadota bacterium]